MSHWQGTPAQREEGWAYLASLRPDATLQEAVPSKGLVENTCTAPLKRGSFRHLGKSKIVVMGKPKEELLQLLEKLPDDVSYEDIRYHIYVQQSVQRGIDAGDQSRVVSQGEVERRMAKWLGEWS